jgi:hypothetical protein
MKITFNRFQYAPKTNGGGKTVAPKTEGATNDNQSSGDNKSGEGEGDTPAGDTATVAAPPAPELTSEQLTKLQEDKKAAQTNLRTLAANPEVDMESKEYLDAQLEVFRINKLIDAEKARIAKEQKDAELAEKRNARVGMADGLITAVLAAVGFDAATLTDDQRAAFAGQREVVVNELLAKYATSAPAKAAATGDNKSGGGAGRGAIAAEIREMFIKNRAAGMSDTDNVKAIIATGKSRGTTGAVVLAYQREIGEKQ